MVDTPRENAEAYAKSIDDCDIFRLQAILEDLEESKTKANEQTEMMKGVVEKRLGERLRDACRFLVLTLFLVIAPTRLEAACQFSQTNMESPTYMHMVMFHDIIERLQGCAVNFSVYQDKVPTPEGLKPKQGYVVVEAEGNSKRVVVVFGADPNGTQDPLVHDSAEKAVAEILRRLSPSR